MAADRENKIGDPARVDPRAWAAPKPPLIRRLVPIAAWLPAYDRRWLRFDLIAGATVWGLLVPEMIAYSGLAGLPPQAGLYTLLVTLAAYAIFGTSRHMVVAGTSASAVLLASGVASRTAAGSTDYVTLAAGLVLLCGGLLLLAGLLRLGFVAQFLSRPVVDGFVFGLAIFVTVSQLPKLFGVEKGSGNTIHQLITLFGRLDETNGPTLAVGVLSLAFLVAIERWAKSVPIGILVLVGGIGISAALNLSTHGVAVVGEVPSGFPSVNVPDLSNGDALALTGVAAGMVLVIFSESLGAAEAFANKYSYEIDANQELIGLGVANLGSGLIGGLAAGGSLSQSAVNESAGARSEASPLVAAVLAVITVLVLMPLFKNLPEATLAALIIVAVSHLWKVREFRRYYAERLPEFGLGMATLIGVITIDVLPGLLIGVVSMLLLVIYQSSRPRVSPLGEVPGVPGAWGNVVRHHDYKRPAGVLVVQLDAPLFYANAKLVRDEVKRQVGASTPLPHAVVIDIGGTADLDVTSAEILKELALTLRAAGIDLALAEAHARVRAMVHRSGLEDQLGRDYIFTTVTEAVEALR